MSEEENESVVAPELAAPSSEEQQHAAASAATLTTSAVEQEQEEQQGQEQSPPPALNGLQRLRRIRRARTQYEKLQRPADITPGSATPSIEGWVVFLTHLPPMTTVEDVQDLLVSFKEGDPQYFGSIHEVKIPLDKDCLCMGHALVELDTKEGFDRACAELPGYPVPFYAEAGSEPRRLGASAAFLAEEDDAVEEETAEALPGDKRGRD